MMAVSHWYPSCWIGLVDLILTSGLPWLFFMLSCCISFYNEPIVEDAVFGEVILDKSNHVLDPPLTFGIRLSANKELQFPRCSIRLKFPRKNEIPCIFTH